MRISSKGRYSLEALLYLALLPEGAFASTREISEKTEVSERYLEQLFIPLRQKGLIAALRGSRGGYYLDKRPDAITVGDILRTVEVSLDLVVCMAALDCPRKNQCETRGTWSALYRGINSFVDSVTLGDLARAYNAVDTPEYTI
ncbi:MAG: Rrf2 family transcriptional regulator [Spirochaetaceae bacterium]|jgi:Rrf2 family protein|nr:Rrf2 family transcriptional regulator [Spirochaetaceae bacterium]